jgi:C-3',4' desaturase CrtD
MPSINSSFNGMRKAQKVSTSNLSEDWDVIIIGSGMGGCSAGTLLSKDNKRVLVLEAALHPGGCSSSYTRKGVVYESGATTLVGFDEHQPLWYLEQCTGIQIPREELNPSMTVWERDHEEPLIRIKNREEWIKIVCDRFGEAKAQKEFWMEAFRVNDRIWQISLKNRAFPPAHFFDWLKLPFANSLRDLFLLPYMRRSVANVAKSFGIKNESFYSFLDEQLMITAQAPSADTPFLFGAPAITYPNASNYYVPGGLIEMIYCCLDYIEDNGGKFVNKQRVTSIVKESGGFQVRTNEGLQVSAPIVVSNAPIWNMPEMTSGSLKEYFENEAKKYNEAWGAFTAGALISDELEEGLSLHHQLQLPKDHPVREWISDSFFVSISKRGDAERAPEGYRALNISTHTIADRWFDLDKETYDLVKQQVIDYLVNHIKKVLPGAHDAEWKQVDAATPRTWEQWVYRKKGRVGGIPQSMSRAIWDWTSPVTPEKGLYLVGDTTYPGQGIPGVTLSGINVYYRIRNDHK